MVHENKFGMFIHWGIYALTELSEQAFIRYDIDRKTYESLKDQFNPVRYNPEEWVLMAKRAGMKYICFTTKHHDGFCMWDTKYTDYNIMNTPYGKDVLKMLADACQKHDMLLSLYYSNPDWHHEDAYNPKSSHQWRAVIKEDSDFERYRAYIRGQITELLTNYGHIYTFFWDINPDITDPSFNELIRQLQPGIYINDRGWDTGDFSTPEREYQSINGKSFTRMTEACNSVGEQSWGYRKHEDFYSIRHLRYSIARVMAMGGSYLLNIGPHHDGSITPEYADRLMQVADWYNRMNGCLECHEPDNYNYDMKYASYIATKKNGKTYFHFVDGLKSSAIALKNYPSMPKHVKLMNTGAELPYSVDILPDFLDLVTWQSGICTPYLHIFNIPVDELVSEPLVIEIEW